ncbi:hypothetical protein KAR91_11050 [Candidatus Pacearchaeota archaeon]|nr:hypothetical protein [Candidatus Pacearchaeota archaeon]
MAKEIKKIRIETMMKMENDAIVADSEAYTIDYCVTDKDDVDLCKHGKIEGTGEITAANALAAVKTAEGM